MEVEVRDGRVFYGEIELIRSDEAAQRLGMGRSWFLQAAKKRALPFLRNDRDRSYWFEKQVIDSWADFRALQRDWHRRHNIHGKREVWREKMDPKVAATYLLTTQQAAAELGVGIYRMADLVQSGKLFCYQGKPGQGGSKMWFSPTAIRVLKEDPQYQAQRARYEANRERRTQRKPDSTNRPEKGVVSHAKQSLRRAGREKELLTTAEAAARLGVSRQRVLMMRCQGRLRGEQVWRRFGYLHFWYFRAVEIDELLEQEGYQEFRAAWEKRQGKRFWGIGGAKLHGETLPETKVGRVW